MGVIDSLVLHNCASTIPGAPGQRTETESFKVPIDKEFLEPGQESLDDSPLSSEENEWGSGGRYFCQPRRGDWGPCFRAGARVHFKGREIEATSTSENQDRD